MYLLPFSSPWWAVELPRRVQLLSLETPFPYLLFVPFGLASLFRQPASAVALPSFPPLFPILCPWVSSAAFPTPFSEVCVLVAGVFLVHWPLWFRWTSLSHQGWWRWRSRDFSVDELEEENGDFVDDVLTTTTTTTMTSFWRFKRILDDRRELRCLPSVFSLRLNWKELAGNIPDR